MAVIAATHSAAASAAVPVGVEATPDSLPAPHRLRSGVALGVQLGAGLVGASGYPNDVSRIGSPSDYSASGLMFGTSETIFVMGALADYLSFGVWYSHAAAANRHWQSGGDGGGLRVEAFPLALASPRLGGLGLLAEFGLGGGKLTSKTPGITPAEGTQSFVAAGVFYEWSFIRVLGGHLSVGPSVEYDTIWSLAFERHGLVASARLVFYGGP